METPEPTPEAAGRVRALFDAAVELPAAERERLLAEVRAEDEDLYRELDSLLEAHERASEFLEHPPLPSPGHRPDPRERIGERLGDYRIERPLGRGGMGAVFLARRADGAYDQTVAVKLLDVPEQGPQATLRFERERQTLAKLGHPNIARLLDGGTTADGVPFLVMECVEGEPIDRYCDRRKLGVQARLELFLQTCAGVQHAHRHLVVHRDLKPANILVTGDGAVKLLDFGIARLLGQLEPEEEPSVSTGTNEPEASRPARHDALTEAGASVFTPGYASPEQIRGEEVSAASDVFSLGLVLHELLCGTRPPAPHHEEAAAPSRTLDPAGAADGANPDEIARRRGVGPARLRRQIQGDLDAIVLKAQAPAEGRRYASAGNLADDLRRHLDHLPVEARAGERTYAARKLVRRHRVAVAAAILLVIALAAGLAATSWQAARAARAQAVAEHRFEQVQELAHSLLFDVHDAVSRLPGATPARHLLVERALTYLDNLRADAADNSSLRLELADAYERIGDIQGNPHQANLGDTEAAVTSYRTALGLRLEQPPASRRSPELRAAIARTHHRIGEVLWWTGDTVEASRQLDLAIAAWQGLARAEPHEADWHRLWAESLTTAGRVRSWNGEHGEALRRFEAAEELLQPLLEDDEPRAVDEALALIHQRRGETLGWMGETDRALEELEHARGRLARLSARYPLDAPLRRRFYLASLRHSKWLEERSPERAIESFHRTLAIAADLAASDPANALARRDLSLAHASFGDVLSNAGDRDAAAEHFRRAQALQRELATEDPNNLGHRADLANSAVRIGYLLHEEGEAPAALASFDEALELRRSLLATDPEDSANRRDVAVVESARGDVLADLAAAEGQGRDAASHQRAACAAYEESLTLWRELEQMGHLRVYDRPQLDHAADRLADCSAPGAP